MAEISRHRTSGADPQPSRLQRRKPAPLQINPPTSSRWNAAIPLLSPLLSSPAAMDLKSREEPQSQPRNQGTEPEKAATVFKKWQHPAAPFCYEPASFAPTFYVPV
ncbi:hypothetical protein JCGZ_02295 [Jatropha curcas]|uniref:Uncharacterized protein n=1 Tax=Jatropha curcas TaxID=180498 RepID=A0A067KVZ3_JATCU|nr:uncharacterized protein At4g14450, chloroplastic [Jatropha curcas]KDP40297.1 hypothetical protein JCGZ_02295 [Jatropha curcas]